MHKRLDTATILAENLRKVTRMDGHKSVRGWAGGDATLARNVSRIIAKETSPSVDVLDEIAAKSGRLQVWHLLLPGLDPSNPPAMTMSESERELYRRLKQSVDALPDT